MFFNILLSATKSHWVVFFTGVFYRQCGLLPGGRGTQAGSGRAACQGPQEHGMAIRVKLGHMAGLVTSLGMRRQLRSSSSPQLSWWGIWVVAVPTTHHLASLWSSYTVLGPWLGFKLYLETASREKSSIISGTLRFCGISDILHNLIRVRSVIRSPLEFFLKVSWI